MIRLVMDLGVDYNLVNVGGRIDINFTEQGQQTLAQHGVVKNMGRPFKMTVAGTDMLVVQVYDWNPSADPFIVDAISICQEKNVPEAAKCFGYYGFGTGFLKGKADLAIVGHGFPPVYYCADNCQVAEECGQQHRLRCDNLGLESGAVAAENAMDGESVARGEQITDRAEATLTWPLKVIQSVIRAN